jgi:hypothetical protein
LITICVSGSLYGITVSATILLSVMISLRLLQKIIKKIAAPIRTRIPIAPPIMIGRESSVCLSLETEFGKTKTNDPEFEKLVDEEKMIVSLLPSLLSFEGMELREKSLDATNDNVEEKKTEDEKLLLSGNRSERVFNID